MSPDTSPAPLTDWLVFALKQLRLARDQGDPSLEWAWNEYLDNLLDRYPRPVS